MIKIDGSYGEGGGQIMRTSLALASLLGEELRITNIRCKRPNPGLARQHLVSVRAIQEITRAEVEGATLGSTELTYTPGKIKPGRYRIDIGTAGSTSMVLQTLLPPCLFASRPVELLIRGGTDVKWSPPADYLRHVFLRILGRMGAEVEMEVRHRGYYPKGGGAVRAVVQPVRSLEPLNLPGRDAVAEIRGLAHSSNLPCTIVHRMAKAVKGRLGHPCTIGLECGEGFSTGTGIVLWTTGEDAYLGSSSLGEIGRPAEKVGREAAAQLNAELQSGASLDSHLGDQVMPYMAIARGRSVVRVPRLTDHLTTSIHVLEKILGTGCKITDANLLSVEGIDLRNEAV